jgi:hypothetical protein
MSTTWEKALSEYRYPVILGRYANADDHVGWFTYDLSNGDHAETTGFERHFRKYAAQGIESWLEVVFWKLFSQPARRNSATTRIEEHFLKNDIEGISLWNACNEYVQNPSRHNFETFRSMFGFTSTSIAIAATFPAFVSPDTYPMIDTRIAKWVGACMAEHNSVDPNGAQLTKPPFLNNGSTVLKMSDFEFMQDWKRWCVHTAQKLKKLTFRNWRARDVEMAVFHAWGGRCNHHPCTRLNPLPPAE